MLLIINFFLKGHSSSANLAFRSNTSELHFWSRGLSMKAGESSRFSASWYFVIFSESMIEWRGNIKLVLCMLNLYIFFFQIQSKIWKSWVYFNLNWKGLCCLQILMENFKVIWTRIYPKMWHYYYKFGPNRNCSQVFLRYSIFQHTIFFYKVDDAYGFEKH